MNLDALSDLVLLLACAWIYSRSIHTRPAVAVAILLIGMAAMLGVFRFGGLDSLLGPHRFMSLLAACSAFPLLAYALRWPEDPTTQRLAGAGRFVVIIGGLGVAITAVAGRSWSQLVPVACSVLIVGVILRARSGIGVLGLLALFASFGVAGAMPADILLAGVVSRVQLMHYLLAMALLALTAVPPLRSTSA